MVKMINASFGNEMWVADDRVEEYKAAGHKLAADGAEEPMEAEVEETAEPSEEPAEVEGEPVEAPVDVPEEEPSPAKPKKAKNKK